MGNTILQSQARNQSGLLLVESFESTNFASDQGWTVLNGAPSISNIVSFSGLFSLIMDSSYPQIQKTFSSAYYWSAGYFYDDASVVGSTFKPFIIWKDSVAVLTYGLGVNDAIMAGRYIMKNGSGADTSTGVLRTTGWHRFEFYYNLATTTLNLKIDGVIVKTQVVTFNPTIIQVGASAFTGTPIFGYFDLIQVTRSPFFEFNELDNGQVVKLFSDADVLLGTATAASNVATIDASAVNQAFAGYVTITTKQGIRPFFQGGVISYASGDKWALNVFDLGRRVSSFGKPRMAARSDLESTSGKNQSLFYFSRDKVSLTLSDLTDDQVQTLHRWWGNAQTGAVFSVAIDSDDLYFQKLTANTVGAATSITVASVAGVNKNSQLMLTRDAGIASEVAKVLSAAATTITFTAALLEQYLIGDAVRHAYYWPFCITTDQAFDPRLINPKLKRWTVTISFKEAL